MLEFDLFFHPSTCWEVESKLSPPSILGSVVDWERFVIVKISLIITESRFKWSMIGLLGEAAMMSGCKVEKKGGVSLGETLYDPTS